MSGEGRMGEVDFVKIQAPSRIPLMLRMSKAKAISLDHGGNGDLNKIESETLIISFYYTG